jgi:hypothetical protein
MSIEDLKQYAANKYSNALGNDTIEVNSVAYPILDLVSGHLVHIYDEAILENAAGVRAIRLPGQPDLIEMTNGQLIAAVRAARTHYQMLGDVFYEVIAQVNQESLITEPQIDAAWETHKTNYQPSRVLAPSNEALHNALQALTPASIQGLEDVLVGFSAGFDELEDLIATRQELILAGDHIAGVPANAPINAPTDAPTNLNALTTLLGVLVGEVNETNNRLNAIGQNANAIGGVVNGLANKFTQLLEHLELQGLQLPEA